MSHYLHKYQELLSISATKFFTSVLLSSQTPKQAVNWEYSLVQDVIVSWWMLHLCSVQQSHHRECWVIFTCLLNACYVSNSSKKIRNKTKTPPIPIQYFLPGPDFLILKLPFLIHHFPINNFKCLVFYVMKMINGKFVKLIFHFPNWWLLNFLNCFWLCRYFFSRPPQVGLPAWRKKIRNTHIQFILFVSSEFLILAACV